MNSHYSHTKNLLNYLLRFGLSLVISNKKGATGFEPVTS